jgi:signal peptidase I
MALNWFYSRTVRHASRMHKHVHKILAGQRDILSRQAIQAVEASMSDLRKAILNNGSKTDLQSQMSSLEKTANKWLKPYPFAGLRENVEVFLVAIAVAMAVRTFFLQPFKIPTGSMQPTLFGITSDPDFSREQDPRSPQNLVPEEDFEMPNILVCFVRFWISGVQYKQVIAKGDGALSEYDPQPRKFLLFNLRQNFSIGEGPQKTSYTVWFPPDNLLKRVGLVNAYGSANPKIFKKGDIIFKIRSNSGDHLFVDRLTYNFRRPRRGEIVVFETRGIERLEQDQYYIKRLIALGGETVQVGNDRHVVINRTNRLDKTTPHFEKVYSFDPGKAPRDSQYSGHLNEYVASRFGMSHVPIAPKLPTGEAELTVRPNHYFVLGDNTVNSFDSRGWGDFPQANVIGKSFFVYWPFGKQDGRGTRFGTRYR